MGTMKQYSGKGDLQGSAIDSLHEAVKAAGATGQPQDMQYRCGINVGDGPVYGKPHADYGFAFASGLEAAGISSTDLDPSDLEVEVTANFAAPRKPVEAKPATTTATPRASGACASTPRPVKLTKLI